MKQNKVSTLSLAFILFALAVTQLNQFTIACAFCTAMRRLLIMISVVLLCDIFSKTHAITLSLQLMLSVCGTLESVSYVLFKQPLVLSLFKNFVSGCKKNTPCHQFPFFGPFHLGVWTIILFTLLTLLSLINIYFVYLLENTSPKK